MERHGTGGTDGTDHLWTQRGVENWYWSWRRKIGRILPRRKGRMAQTCAMSLAWVMEHCAHLPDSADFASRPDLHVELVDLLNSVTPPRPHFIPLQTNAHISPVCLYLYKVPPLCRCIATVAIPCFALCNLVSCILVL